MRIILLISSFFLINTVFSQYDHNRYKVESLTVNRTNGVEYGKAPKWTVPYNDEKLKLDVYVPENDTLSKRPLLIMAHSGGFLNGDKDVDDMVALCDSFARKGFVTASIAYRKGFNPLDDGSAERAVYRGIQDGKAAVRFFKEKATDYNIDTNYIFFGGMSAGGYIALHVAYMDKESERPQSTYGGGLVNDLKCLDCAGNTYQHSSKVRAILDFWGALQDTTIIEAGDIPALIMHGANDGTVPYVYGHPFGLGTLPKTYGGKPISERLVNLGIEHEFITSNSNLHMLDGSDNGTFPSSGPNAFWHDTLMPRTINFLYNQVKPYPTTVSSTVYACKEDVFKINVTPDGIVNKNIWITDGSEVTVTDAENGMFSVSQIGTYTVGYVQVNHLLAYSDTLWHTVVISDFTPTMNYTDNNGAVTFTTENYSSYNWEIDGQTYTSASPTVNLDKGTYQVTLTVTNDQNCTKTITEAVSVEGLGLEVAKKAPVKVYPNPAKTSVTVSNLPQQATIAVIDITGKAVFTTKASFSKTIDVSSYANGVYVVQINSNEGLITKRLVVGKL